MIWLEKSEKLCIVKDLHGNRFHGNKNFIKPTLNSWGWSNMYTHQI